MAAEVGEEPRGDPPPHAFSDAELARLATYREAVRSGLFNDRDAGRRAPARRQLGAQEPPAWPVDPAFGF